MVFVRDLLRTYSPNAVRVYLLQHHYRAVWEWSPEALDAAAAMAARMETAARSADTSSPEIRETFRAALADDLDTPRAVDTLTRASGQTLRELGAVLGLAL
jgi:cysteinyl-tRNA synthetase